VASIPFSYINEAANNIKFKVLILGIIAFVLSMLASIIISGSISKPLRKLVYLLKQSREGNLALEVSDNNKDEIGDVITSFSEMVNKMRSLIVQVKSLSEKVSSSTETITDTSTRFAEISEQISRTTVEVANGASEQAADVDACAEYMNILAENINLVDFNMASIDRELEGVRLIKIDSESSIKILNDKASATAEASNRIWESISDLNDNMKEIKDITKMIVSIADQTNLLSLNAAIEAARAGESGKGFAVVADEVRKLAEKSKEASIKINSILQALQDKAEAASKEALSTNNIVIQQIEAVNKSGDAFMTIFKAINTINEEMNSTVKSIKDISVSKERTLESIENISTVSNQTAAITEEVSASTQEQMSSSEELLASARELNKSVEQLNNSIAVFIVD
jgi:methyl-accepting chemotaxis protein